jgi:Xaa-Pro aminopeptidase
MKKILFGVVLLAVAFALELPVRGASDSAWFAGRRAALMKRIEGGIAVLQGAPETRAYERFRQGNDFYYLTGVETPGAMVLIDAARNRSLLFLPPRNVQAEGWEGPKLSPGEAAREATGFDEVLEIARFGAALESAGAGGKAVFTPFRPEETAAVSRDRALQFDTAQEQNPWDGRVSREKAFQVRLREKLGGQAAVKDLSPILDGMRRVKDEQEIQRLRQAGKVGALGVIEAIRSTEPGLYEYQVAAVAEFIFKWHGAMGPSYFAVAGSGPNTCVLHYSVNSRRMAAGDLMVLDFGPDYAYYEADITRTFPVSGKFTEEQARVYEVVLEAQRAAIAKIKPGATFASINTAARDVVEHAGYGKFWRHGVSHYVGMSVHDVGGMDPFEPGVVITVEPGIYIPEKSLGIRIEDTVLVTRDGCDLLTTAAPRDIPSLQNLMGSDQRKLNKIYSLPGN